MSGHITRMSRGWRRRVVVEQTDEHLAQHVDLPGRTVAGVHLEAAVGDVDGTGGALGGRGRVVGAQVVLQPAQQRARGSLCVRERCGHRLVSTSSREGAPQLAGVATERGEQRVVHALAGAVVVAQRPPRRGRPGRPREPATAWGSQRWTSRVRAKASSSRTSVTGSRVWPNSESRSGRSSPSPPASSRPTARASRTSGGSSPTWRAAPATGGPARRGRRGGRDRRRR